MSKFGNLEDDSEINAGLGSIIQLNYWRQAYLSANALQDVHFQYKSLENLWFCVYPHVNRERREKIEALFPPIRSLMFDSRIRRHFKGEQIQRSNYNKAIGMMHETFKDILLVAHEKGLLMRKAEDPSKSAYKML